MVERTSLTPLLVRSSGDGLILFQCLLGAAPRSITYIDLSGLKKGGEISAPLHLEVANHFVILLAFLFLSSDFCILYIYSLSSRSRLETEQTLSFFRDSKPRIGI